MRDNSVRKLVITVFAILLIGGLLVDSAAQKRRRTRRRTSAPKITNPEIYQPSPGDNSNSNSSESSTTNGNSNSNSPSEDPESMKRTIRTLSNQVDRLTDKLNDLQTSQQSMVDLERLSRSEQRSAQLRTELSGVQAKKSELAAHLEDVEYALKPENIERAAAGIGTTRPEEVREQRRKQLESDRTRTQQQLDQLNANEARLQQAIATSDADVDRLQKKLDAADRAAIENAKTNAQSGASQVAASPTPTP
jgi:DNA repair exonuclease SbcCD ATPase subunit